MALTSQLLGGTCAPAFQLFRGARLACCQSPFPLAGSPVRREEWGHPKFNRGHHSNGPKAVALIANGEYCPLIIKTSALNVHLKLLETALYSFEHQCSNTGSWACSFPIYHLPSHPTGTKSLQKQCFSWLSWSCWRTIKEARYFVFLIFQIQPQFFSPAWLP